MTTKQRGGTREPGRLEATNPRPLHLPAQPKDSFHCRSPRRERSPTRKASRRRQRTRIPSNVPPRGALTQMTTFRGNVISISGNSSSFDEFLIGKRDQLRIGQHRRTLRRQGLKWVDWGVYNPIRASGYLHPALWHELPRLHAELVAYAAQRRMSSRWNRPVGSGAYLCYL
jgi:hypothetical protein